MLEALLDATLFDSIGQLVLAGAVLLLAQAVYALYGFGSGLLSVALLAFLFPDIPRVVVLLLLVNLPTELFVVVRERAQLALGTAGLLLAGIAAGIPVGALLLEAGAGSAWLVRALAAVIVLLAINLAWNGDPSPGAGGRRVPPAVDLAAGTVSGVLSGLFGTGGPPLIVVLHRRGLDKRAFRATLLALFLAMSVVRVPVYFWRGIADERAVVSALVMLPAALAGLAAGHLVHARIPERTFRRGVAVLLGVLGVLMWLRG
ncbi:MAG: sulfite exporter TauE/SafE family protein [Acidobacteria bacterium]|nr:MAG: sulfite exporter TauE/SafE family protein [Acidobacteriota bacterium]